MYNTRTATIRRKTKTGAVRLVGRRRRVEHGTEKRGGRKESAKRTRATERATMVGSGWWVCDDRGRQASSLLCFHEKVGRE